MQAELSEQSSQAVQTKKAYNPKSSNKLQNGIDLFILGDSVEELKPAEDDHEDLLRDLFSIFDSVEGSGDELNPTKWDKDLLKELTLAKDLSSLEGSADELKSPKGDGDLLKDLLSVYGLSNCEGNGDKLKPPKEESNDLNGFEVSADESKPPEVDGDLLKDVLSFYGLSTCEDNGDQVKPPKGDDEHRCDGEFDSLFENIERYMISEGTYIKRKLPSSHTEDHEDDFPSRNKRDLSHKTK